MAGARAGCAGSARSFALAGLLAGLATLVPQRRRARHGRAWRWPSSGTGCGRVSRRSDGAAHVRLASRSRPPSAPSALFAVAMAPWYLRQLVGLRLALAVHGVRQGAVHPRHRRVEQHHHARVPRPPPGHGHRARCCSRASGGLVAAVFIFSVLVGALVLVPPLRHRGVARGAATRPSGRSSSTPPCCSRSARSSPRSTSRAGRSSTPPWRWCRTGTSWRSGGIVVAVGWVAARRTGWDAERAARVFVGGAVAFGVDCRRRGLVRGPRQLGRQAHPDAGRGRGARRGRCTGGRTGSCRSTPPATGTGRATGGVVLVNDPIATVEEVARAYDIRWLVLERADTVPAAHEILVEGRPPGLGGAADPRVPRTSPSTRCARRPAIRAAPPRCAR